MDQSVLEPIEVETGREARWMVVIYNNDTNSVEEVVTILVASTGCSIDEAEIEMWEAHTLGKSSVHFAARQECESVARMIASIGVRTDVAPEWGD